MAKTIEGGCLCGAVRYQASGDVQAQTLCHCRSCRLAGGGPSLAWVSFASERFRFTGASPVAYASSPGVTRTFCGRCGTALSWQKASETDSIDITMATLDDPDAFPPTIEIWIEHRLAWEALNPAIAHYARSSVGAQPVAD